MTTATLVTHGQTVDTEMARPRRSLEELVDLLIEALFPAQTETAEPSVTRTIHEARRLRQAGGHRLRPGRPRRRGHGEGGNAPSEMGLRRGETDGGASVRRQQPAGLLAGHGTGCVACAPRRRLAGGGGGPRDALAARQARLGAQLAGPLASKEGLPPPQTEERRVAVLAHTLIATPALKARCPSLPLYSTAGAWAALA